MPDLPVKLEKIYFENNPVCESIPETDLWVVKKNVKILNRFRHLYYCIKYKEQFKEWLWEKIRKPKIMEKYHPDCLLELLGDDDENLTEESIDELLSNW